MSSVAYMRHGVDASGRRLGVVSESYATTGLTYMNIDDAMANGVAKKVTFARILNPGLVAGFVAGATLSASEFTRYITLECSF
jgi:hypothetical protein